MKEVVDQAYRTGDTVGGVFEVVAHGVPPGLGSHVTWDSRLDGRLAQAIVSMQAVKGVEIGFAAEGAASFGSRVQDTIHYNREERHFTRGANRAGGLEGGMTNGQDVLVRGMLKPISTLRRPLESVDLTTREPALAAYERSDVCVVPAAGVIGEAMVPSFWRRHSWRSLAAIRWRRRAAISKATWSRLETSDDVFDRFVRRAGARKAGRGGNGIRYAGVEQADRGHVRIDVRRQGRWPGRAADRHRASASR